MGRRASVDHRVIVSTFLPPEKVYTKQVRVNRNVKARQREADDTIKEEKNKVGMDGGGGERERERERARGHKKHIAYKFSASDLVAGQSKVFIAEMCIYSIYMCDRRHEEALFCISRVTKDKA